MPRASRLVSAPQLARRRFAGVDLPGVYGRLLGDPPPNVYVLVKGPAGSGKSTFTLGLADAWAGTVGPSLYVAAEEGISKSLRDRAVRTGADSPGLHFSTFEGFDGVLADAKSIRAGLVVLDSISSADPHSRHFAAFAKDAAAAGFALVLVAHETKAGKHRGSSSLAYDPAVVVRVAHGVAATEKNRHAPLTAVDVDFGTERTNPSPACDCQPCGACGGVLRSNPPHSGACAHATGTTCACSCGGRMHRSGLTKTVGRVKTAGKQSAAGKAAMAGMTAGGTKRVVPGARPVRRANPDGDTVLTLDGDPVTVRSLILSNPDLTTREKQRIRALRPGQTLMLGGGAGALFEVHRPGEAQGRRANPVPTPFGATFAEIARTHTIAGAAKLNKLVGFESPALLDFAENGGRLPKGQTLEGMVERAERAQMAFSWKSRSRTETEGTTRRVGVLTVALFGESTDPDLFEDPAGRAYADPWSRAATVYEFPGQDFADALRKFLVSFGGLRVAVYDQHHAKLVLGAKEYRRQEKLTAPDPAPPPGDVGRVLGQSRRDKAKAPRKPRVSAPRPKPAKKAPRPKAAPRPKTSAAPAGPRKTSVPPPVASSQSSGAGDLGAFDAGMNSIEAMLAKALA